MVTAMIVSPLNRKLAARPPGDEGPGVRDRHGRGRRRGDVRDVPVELRLAAARRSAPTTSGSGSPTCSPSLKRAPLRVAADIRRHPRRVGHRDARGRQRHARRSTAGRAGDRPARLDPRRSAAAGQRPLPAARTLDRAGPARRGARQRGLRHRARARSPGDTRRGGHQRPAAPPDHRRRGAVARVRLQHPARRAGARRPALRHLLDGSARRWRPPSTWKAASTTSRWRWRPAPPSDEAIAQLDRLLEPYGGLGAIPRALQLSHWTVENELAQLQSFGFMLPLIFLMVAAFILNVALTRALALQRPQIAALKALGYANAALGWHYLKWALRHRRRRGRRSASPRGGWLGQHDHRALQPVLPVSRAAVPAVRWASCSARRL